jgi:hypothetical protein
MACPFIVGEAVVFHPESNNARAFGHRRRTAAAVWRF